MTKSSPLLAAWHSAEQESKLLFAYWTRALAAHDMSAAAQLRVSLVVQRAVAHEAFERFIERAADESRACRHFGVPRQGRSDETIPETAQPRPEPRAGDASPSLPLGIAAAGCEAV